MHGIYDFICSFNCELHHSQFLISHLHTVRINEDFNFRPRSFCRAIKSDQNILKMYSFLPWRVKVMEKSGRLAERVMAGEVEGRRPRGRPRKRWGDPF